MGFFGRLAEFFGGRTRAPIGHAAPVEVHVPPRVGDRPQDSEAQKIVKQICQQALATPHEWRAKLNSSRRWQVLKDEPPERQIAVMLAAIYRKPTSVATIYNAETWQAQEVRKAIVSQFFLNRNPNGASPSSVVCAPGQL